MDGDLILDEVLDIELRMFLSVNAEGNPSCRESPDNFRLHRSAQFSVWSDSCLASYLDDLRNAELSGRNIMTYKYARMDQLIPPGNDSPLIELIAAVQLEWQRELLSEYPKLAAGARGLTDGDPSSLAVSFERYLRAELESYSPRTLEFLFADVCGFKEEGKNMSELIYLNLVGRTGLNSLDKFR